MSYVAGIDLGTGNSVVAVFDNGHTKVIENHEGSQTTPSVINFDPQTNEIIVGVTAKRKSTVDPLHTIYEIKRFMGRKFDDSEVQRTIPMVPYSVIKSGNGDVAVKVLDKEYSPPEISAHILKKMKKTIEDHLGQSVDKAVITVPAYFNNDQRQATIDAGKIAGLEVLRIINEPTAAALAFCQDKTFKESQHLLVLDFGSGTLDVSILDALTVDGDLTIEVASTSGDTHLGGSDIDEKIIAFLADEFKKQEGFDVKNDPVALSRVKEAAEKAKIELSTMMQTDIALPYLTADATGPKHFNHKFTRAKLEALIEPLIDRIFSSINTALNDAKLKSTDIHEVLLVGGSTRIPMVQEKIKAFFGKEGNKSVNPDLAVALGAAIQGSVLAGTRKDVLLLDVIPLSLSIETAGDLAVVMVEKNTTVPYTKTEKFSTASDNQPAVTIRVAQGEYKQFTRNTILGQFDLDGIPPAPRGVPQIEVSFEVDSNSILTVKAKDTATGKVNHITITGSSGLSKEDIAQAIQDFEQHKMDDEKFAEIVSFRNRLDSTTKSIDDMLLKDNCTDADKETLNAAKVKFEDLKSKIESSTKEELDKEYYNIMNDVTAISARWYQEANPQPSTPDNQSPMPDMTNPEEILKKAMNGELVD